MQALLLASWLAVRMSTWPI